MRPINKGLSPLGLNIKDYAQWRRSLIDRIGYYCVYCNMPLSHQLQVEHVVPKNAPAGYVSGDPLAWDNMLLACGPCNNAKSNSPVDAQMYYLPESHNTHLPFRTETITRKGKEYQIVIPSAELEISQKEKAQRTINLLKLDHIDERNAIVDLRSLKRYGALIAVKSAKEFYDMTKSANPTVGAQLVVNFAKEIGFFSIWYECFEKESEVMKQLAESNSLPGTDKTCFDCKDGYKPIPRNPLNINDPI